MLKHELLLLHLLLALTTTCATATARDRDRLEDAGDIAGISSEFLSLGLSAAVGPVSAGAGVHRGNSGHLSGADPQNSVMHGTLLLGLGCDWLLHTEAVGQATYPSYSIPPEYIFRNKRSCADEEDPRFAPYQWGRLRIALGLGVMGFTAELNWLEFLDFLAGYAGTDLLDDDAATYYENFARERAEDAGDSQTSAP